MNAVFVEPFMGGSHAAFARGWVSNSRHRWRIVSLPAGRWKWRVRVGAWVLGRRVAQLAPPPDVVVATSLLDLAHLRLASGLSADAPFVLYMHENQLTYPRPRKEKLDRGFAAAHVASLLAADGVAFNSRSHRSAFAEALRGFVAEIPPPRPRGLPHVLRSAPVLLPGVDLTGFPAPAPRTPGKPPAILWNHRWEEDKRPAAFARTLLRLAENGCDFRLILLGAVEQLRPRPLELVRERLGPRIVRDGPATTRREYIAWLARADIAVSTAAQETFGYAMVEAMAAGAVPLAPRRLSYPELLPRRRHGRLLYGTDRELADRLAVWLTSPDEFAGLRAGVMAAAHEHEWPARAAALDDWVEQAAGATRG